MAYGSILLTFGTCSYHMGRATGKVDAFEHVSADTYRCRHPDTDKEYLIDFKHERFIGNANSLEDLFK